MTAQVHAISEVRLPEVFWLRGHRIDLNSNSVTHGGRDQRLTPKAAAVLAYLAGRPGRAVPRDELLEVVWADAFPTDDVLSHAITELRRAFGDDARNSRVIETIPKVGYRLLVEPDFSTSREQRSTRVGKGWTAATIAGAFAVGAVVGALVLDAWQPEAETPVERSEDPLRRSFPVAARAGPESMPALSWDGRQVAYVTAEQAGSQTDIHVKALGAEAARPLTETPDSSEYSPAWSPDDSRVAFLRFDHDGCRVVLRPVSGGLERQLGECPSDAITYIDWSPDGGRLALSNIFGRQQTTSIILLDVETGVAQPLDYPLSSEHDVQPRFSPDGRWIAFRRGANPRSELYLVAADGGEVTALTEFGSRIYGFDWMSDSRRIWLCAQNEGQPALWEASIHGDRLRQVSSACAYGLSIAVHRPVLAFEEHSGDSNLLQVSTSDLQEDELFVTTRDERDPAFSPDGSRLVFVSNRSGEDQLWLGDRASGQAYQLTRLAGLALSQPRFFPDGESVAFLGNGGGRESMYQVRIRSGIVERLSLDGERVRAVAPSDHGLFLASDRSGSWEIWRLDPARGTAEQMTDQGGHRPAVPGDGYLYYTKLDRYGVWRRPVAGGAEELVSEAVHYYSHESWFIRNGYLYFPVSGKEEEIRIVRRPLADAEQGEPEEVVRFQPQRAIRFEDISPDAASLLMSEVKDKREDIVAASLSP